MGDKSGIEWTDATWNPTTGCDQVSPGCDHCYALTLAKRLKAMGSAAYQQDGDPRTSGPGFALQMHPDRLDQPLRWTKPRRIFVNSMSDLFHPKVTDVFIAQVFAVMAVAEQHTYQVLTKRPRRMKALLTSPTFASQVAQVGRELYIGDQQGWLRAGGLLGRGSCLPNVWLGTSVEDQQRADERIPALLDTPAAVRFLSCEPLLGRVHIANWLHDSDCPPLEAPDLCICGDREMREVTIDWVIVGGESGAEHRPMQPEWARTLRDQCIEAGVPFLFKQWGGRTPKADGRDLDGRIWDQFPQEVPA